LDEEFSHIDWKLRERRLLEQLRHKVFSSDVFHVPCIPKILFAQQLALTSRIKQRDLETKLRNIRLKAITTHDKKSEYKQINISVLGDPGVDRTSWLIHEISYKYPEVTPQVPPDDQFGGRIWRTAIFHNDCISYYCCISQPSNNEKSIDMSLRNCDVVVLVYDMNIRNHTSYTHWIKKIGNIPCFVVGLNFHLNPNWEKKDIPAPMNEIGNVKYSIDDDVVILNRLILCLTKKSPNFEY
jgi:hypothetical protein